MSNETQDPIDNSIRVIVRQTATGFEQGIAAIAGLLTAGPLGSLASWGTIRGVQGKWTPWFILGIPAACIINAINFGIFTAIISNNDNSPSPESSVEPSESSRSLNQFPSNSVNPRFSVNESEVESKSTPTTRAFDYASFTGSKIVVSSTNYVGTKTNGTSCSINTGQEIIVSSGINSPTYTSLITDSVGFEPSNLCFIKGLESDSTEDPLISSVNEGSDFCLVNDPNDSYANIRKSPNGELIGPLSNGKKLSVISITKDQQGRGWSLVEYGDKTGFIMTKLVDC